MVSHGFLDLGKYYVILNFCVQLLLPARTKLAHTYEIYTVRDYLYPRDHTMFTLLLIFHSMRTPLPMHISHYLMFIFLDNSYHPYDM